MSLEQGKLGYAFNSERLDELNEKGADPVVLLQKFKEDFPKLNTTADPTDILIMLNQGMQGSCQGHALATIFSICFWLTTGRVFAFSRACGYYMAQMYDGLRGDVGSTLNGGRRVATEHGMCLEEDWPYPERYHPTKPARIKFEYKLQSTKPMSSVDDIVNWLNEGLPVQTGVIWDNSCNNEVVDRYDGSNPRTGGHSTVFWLYNATTRKNVRNINSWGEDWNGDGVHDWTIESIERAVDNPNNVFVGYAPDNMSFPDIDPVSM